MDAGLAKPDRHWFHFPIQVAVVAFLVYWHWHTPPPNKAVLWLGGVVAIMALVEMRPMHKAIYFLLIIGLMFIENRAINKDRADFVRDEACRRKEENKQFRDIGDSLRDKFQRMLDLGQAQFEATARKEQVAIDEITGGDSYVVVAPNMAPAAGNKFPLVALLCDKCKYSIPHVRIYVQADLSSTAYGLLLYEGPMDFGYPLELAHTITAPITGESGLRVTVLARSRPTQEMLKVRFTQGMNRWEASWEIKRETSPVHQNSKTKRLEPGSLKPLEEKPWGVPLIVLNHHSFN
ncbi:MAG: hypothetical protein ACYDDS_15985 [Candidatus Sulfotelmatobacter sp.]